MSRALERLARKLVRFARAREAVAAVEFAIILPVMLSMYVGSIELGQAITIDQRVTTIAGTILTLIAVGLAAVPSRSVRSRREPLADRSRS